MKTEKAEDFKKYFDEAISENGQGIFGSRMILNNGSSEQIETFSNVLKLPEDEEIIVFFDDTIKSSGKGGLAFTSWGVRYRDNGAQKKWNLSWEELGEKYTFRREGLINKKLMLHNDQGNLFTVDKEICLSYASFDLKWLEIILLKGCVIMNGKNPYAASGAAQDNEDSKPKNKIEEEPKAEDTEHQIVLPQKAVEPEEKHKEELHGYYKRKTKAKSSFFAENIFSVIVAILFTVISIGSGLYTMAVLVLPLSFFGSFLGNKIRLWIHPDFLITDGFMGLIKEKLFWRFGPQLIGGLIGFIISLFFFV